MAAKEKFEIGDRVLIDGIGSRYKVAEVVRRAKQDGEVLYYLVRVKRFGFSTNRWVSQYSVQGKL